MKPSSGGPGFLSIGHVTHDLVEGGIQLGGAALYSSLTAYHLGKHTSLLTSCGEDFAGKGTLEALETKAIPSPATSTFRNLYEGNVRVQYVTEVAASLDTRHLPAAWENAGVVYLCPVLQEVSPNLVGRFSCSIVGVAPQGWMRQWDETGRIRPKRLKGVQTLLGHARMVIVSEQDIEGNEDTLEEFRRVTPIVILTRAQEGAVIYTPERTVVLGSYSAKERDPTGAGDCFGAAFLMRYAETGGDVVEAGRFASCVGSFVVEGAGIGGIPTREDVAARMKAQVLSVRITPG